MKTQIMLFQEGPLHGKIADLPANTKSLEVVCPQGLGILDLVCQYSRSFEDLESERPVLRLAFCHPVNQAKIPG